LSSGRGARSAEVLDYWQERLPGRFYIELQRLGRAGEREYLAGAVEAAAARAVPVVATNDVCFLERSEENQSFDLNKIKSLTLKIDHAEIALVQGKGNELTMTLNQELKRGDADVCVHEIKHSKSADSLEIYTKAKKRSSFSNCRVKRTVQIQLDQETIQQMNVQHNHGAFTADTFTAKNFALNISHSKITLGNIDSETAMLQFDHADLHIETITSKKIEIKGAHGATHINAVSSDQLVLERSHGNIEINKCQASQFTSRQNHGSLLLNAYVGKELSVRNGHGRITVSEGQAENVELENSHSSINYSGNSNTLRFSNKHGSTKITQHNANFKNIEGKARHGSIDIELPKNSLCELEGAALKKASATMFREDGACDQDKSSGMVKVDTEHGKASISVL
jgi:DUF4097 and DUF4098 domain-containing protein YvlB